jgi:hypothetical protein
LGCFRIDPKGVEHHSQGCTPWNTESCRFPFISQSPLQHHLTFNVKMPASAQMIDRIQNRTTTCVSLHCFISK